MLGLEEEMSYSRKSSESREKEKTKGILVLEVHLLSTHMYALLRATSDSSPACFESWPAPRPVGLFGSWLRAKL